MAQRKGKTGELLERVLGAAGGSVAGPDFPSLGVELKTIPVDRAGKPIESTFVCALSLREVERLEWDDSLPRRKLARVLWLPIVVEGETRSIGRALLWEPTKEQERVLQDDFEELVGMIAIGKIESLTARIGRWLQMRPKAAHSRVQTRVLSEHGEATWTVPRGLYLRARFTAALLRDPTTTLGA